MTQNTVLQGQVVFQYMLESLQGLLEVSDEKTVKVKPKERESVLMNMGGQQLYKLEVV